jgi:hypothetical protein
MSEPDAFDSDIGQLREWGHFLQQALTDCENLHSKRDRQAREIVAVLTDILRSRLFDHRACLAVSKELSAECLCGYTPLAARLESLTGVAAAELDDIRHEQRELKERFGLLRKQSRTQSMVSIQT